MGKVKYRIEEKLQVVREYERGTCGYKRLARKYNLSRDTVRAWVLNPKLLQQALSKPDDLPVPSIPNGNS